MGEMSDIVNGTPTVTNGAIVSCCYNTTQNSLIVSWRGEYNQVNFINLKAALPKIQSFEVSGSIESDVYCCSSNLTSVYFCLSKNFEENFYAQVYSYDLSTTNIALIGSTEAYGALSNIFCSYAIDETTPQVIISCFRVDKPYYGLYNANTTDQTITLNPLSSDQYLYVPTATVSSCFNPDNNTIFFTLYTTSCTT